MHAYTLHIHGETRGPYSLEQIRAGLADGSLHPELLAWRPGLAEWGALGTLIARDTGEAPPSLPPSDYSVSASFEDFNRAPRPTNWLVPAILVTIFCCIPLGIPAIIFAVQANTAIESGNMNAASIAAGKAKTFTLIAIAVGLLSIFCACSVNPGLMLLNRTNLSHISEVNP